MNQSEQLSEALVGKKIIETGTDTSNDLCWIKLDNGAVIYIHIREIEHLFGNRKPDYSG